MPNQQQMTLTEQVRLHGELLARLATLVEEDRKDLEELKKSTELLAKVVAERETKESLHADIRARILTIGVPLVTSAGGVLLGHFLR